MKSYENIMYKQTDRRPLYLDVHMPEGTENPPLVFWIHGGGWSGLNRKWNLMMSMVERGYAVASPDYRYNDEGKFPTQIVDLKDALLFLREHAAEYGYDPSKVIASGDSAGAHLAAMMAVSAGNADWESRPGDYSIQASVLFNGCFWLPVRSKEGTDSELSKLLGAPGGTQTFVSRAANASPISHIDGSEGPVLLIHGTRDEVVPNLQSRMMRDALEAAGVPVHYYLVPGGIHGMCSPVLDDVIVEFMDYYIKGRTTVCNPKIAPEQERYIPVVE